MKYFKIIKITLLISICLAVVVPMWINFLDNGLDKLSIEELNGKSKKLSSLNLELSGKVLFNQLCEFIDEDENGKIDNVLFYAPIVSNKWVQGDPIESIIIFDSGKRSWDSNFNEAVIDLEHTIDSLMAITAEISVLVAYKKYDVFKFDDKPIECLKSKFPQLLKSREIKKLVYNEKHSLGGKLFVSLFALVLGIGVYYKYV